MAYSSSTVYEVEETREALLRVKDALNQKESVLQQHGIDIEALKKDENFQRDLANLEKEMRAKKSIDAGYKLLGMKLAIEAKEEEINEIFTFLVNESFDRFSRQVSGEERI